MNFDRKTALIAVVLLFVVLVIAFNLEKFTGNITSEKTTPPKVYLSASPKLTNQDKCVIKGGSNIYITVETGSAGIKSNGYVYDNNGNSPIRLANIEFDQNCEDSICGPDKITWTKYTTPWEWKGSYCIKVKEIGTDRLTGKCFTIE